MPDAQRHAAYRRVLLKISGEALAGGQGYGIDPDTIVTTPANRPIKLIVEDAPLIEEAIL